MLPIKIDPCPIVEAVVEFRFSTSLPTDAVFGVVYSKLSDVFPKMDRLPISQIPEAIRNQDPNLRYQPQYVIKHDNLHLKIGPRVLTFSNINEYVGWDSYSTFIKSTLDRLLDTDVIQFPERIGIRYINLFKFPILDNLNLQIILNESKLSEQTTTLRTELAEEDILKVIQIVNNTGVMTYNYSDQGSLVDIDCIYNFPNASTDFYLRYYDLMQKAHLVEKSTFFSLLKEDFLRTLNPVYSRE